MLSVSNCTVCANFNIKIDLKEFSKQTSDIEYNPKKFSGAILKFRKPKSTCLIFSNGKINCVGCKTLNDAKLAVKLSAKKLKKTGLKPLISNLRLTNYSCSASLNQKLDLDKMSLFLGQKFRLDNEPKFLGPKPSYEPEIFCGLIITFSNCSATIHNSGKVILTGSTNISHLTKALNYIVDKVFEFHFLESC